MELARRRRGALRAYSMCLVTIGPAIVVPAAEKG